MTEPTSIRMLKHFARDLGVSFDAPIEEIQRSYERRKSELEESLGTRSIKLFILQRHLQELKSRKTCKECKVFCSSLWMKALPNSYNRIFCGDECLSIYKLRLEADQLRLPAILQIINQWQQNGITHEEGSF